MSAISTPSSVVHASAHRLFSIRRTAAIASNTFRDLVRQKVFYFMLIFALILIGGSVALAALSFQGKLKTVIDVSFGAMTIFTMLLAVLSTAMLLPKDMEDRTLYTILAKPVGRFEYLLGKLIGVTMVLFTATVLMTALLCLVLLYWRGQAISEITNSMPPELAAVQIARLRDGLFTPTIFGGIAIIFVRSVVCATLTLMLSCFATSWLFTVITALMMILIGYLVPVARSAWEGQIGNAAGLPFHITALLRVVTVCFPDMQLFNIVDDISVGVTIGADIFLRVTALGAGYTAIYLLAGYLFFAWKEL